MPIHDVVLGPHPCVNIRQAFATDVVYSNTTMVTSAHISRHADFTGTVISTAFAKVLRSALDVPRSIGPGDRFDLPLVNLAGECHDIRCTIREVIDSFPITKDGSVQTSRSLIYIAPSLDEVLKEFDFVDANQVAISKEVLTLNTPLPNPIFLKAKKREKCYLRSASAIVKPLSPIH